VHRKPGNKGLSFKKQRSGRTRDWRAAGAPGFPPASIDGVNTPELMVADNDYAVGKLIQKISQSIYANNTLMFIAEDDAQDGGDHYDSHRTVALVAGAYVKQGALIHTPYNTIHFVRTMEEVLGLSPMNLNDAQPRPWHICITRNCCAGWHDRSHDPAITPTRILFRHADSNA
jgi:hypothetical protein